MLSLRLLTGSATWVSPRSTITHLLWIDASASPSAVPRAPRQSHMASDASGKPCRLSRPAAGPRAPFWNEFEEMLRLPVDSGVGRSTKRGKPEGLRPTDSLRRRTFAMADATHTVRLHRVLHAPAERVYRAFLDPDAMAK